MDKSFTFEQVEKALVKAYGIVSEAARILKCDRRTIYNYFDAYPELEKIRAEQREAFRDLVETSLIDRIKAKDTTAIIFAAKTLVKERGYVEKQEINVSGEIAVKTYVTISPDEWDETN